MPTPYIVDRFNALVTRNDLDFEAWFSGRRAPDRSWTVSEASWQFYYRYLPKIGRDGYGVALPLPLLSRKRPDVLVMLHSEPTAAAAMAVARSMGIKVIFRVLKTFDAWIERRSWKEKLKRCLFSQADGIIVAGPDSRDFALGYGAPRARIHRVRQTVDQLHLRAASAKVGAQREEIRAQFGLTGTTFIYVGRLWRGKGVNYLIEAFAAVQGRTPEPMSLLIVGDGDEEERLRSLAHTLRAKNVIFAGFIQGNELVKAYVASDVFVLPTLGDPYNLALDEALSCSLPVIATRAVGEVRTRVRDGLNGFVIDEANVPALEAPIEVLAADPELRTQMGRRSLLGMLGIGPTAWADDFRQAVDLTLRTSTE